MGKYTLININHLNHFSYVFILVLFKSESYPSQKITVQYVVK